MTRRELKLVLAFLLVALLVALVNAYAVSAGWFCSCGGAR